MLKSNFKVGDRVANTGKLRDTMGGEYRGTIVEVKEKGILPTVLGQSVVVKWDDDFRAAMAQHGEQYANDVCEATAYASQLIKI